jgi:hypothetical protein
MDRKRAILTAGLLVCSFARGHLASLPELYAPQGELILVQLASAPFPHPKRADGHTYKDKQYDAKEHYSDSTVAIFVPKSFHVTSKLDFVVHFHGWNNNVPQVLGRYNLIEQLTESHRNAILIVPQGSRNAPDSFGGKLEDPDGFKRFMEDVLNALRDKPAFKGKDVALGKIVLSGHSGGYKVISSILEVGGLTEHVTEVWLFDALYGQTPKFLAWYDRQPGRLLNIYTDHGGTKEETEKLMATLKQRGTVFFAGKEGDAKAGDLEGNRPVFLYTDLAHDEVLAKHQTFLEFLKTSGLSPATAK